MNTIVKMIFGSHLYGTDTPTSDKDYKGIFMPSKEQIYLGKIPKSYNESTKSGSQKNTQDDIDTEMYSLHYFINLACEGQTVVLDMLHAPDNMILESSDIWERIVHRKSLFYTKNMNAFVGYARRQAAKYGIKGSRLAAAKSVLDFIDYYLDSEQGGESGKYYQVKDVWDRLPRGEHIHDKEVDPNGHRIYEICGKKIEENVSLEYFYKIMEKFYHSYGERAKQAEKNEGIDWKAVSHALRAAYQVKEILINQTITYPLEEAEFIKKVKSGYYDYKTVVSPILEQLMFEVEVLSATSNLPEKVDRKFWDDFIIYEVEKYLRRDNEVLHNGIYETLI